MEFAAIVTNFRRAWQARRTNDGAQGALPPPLGVVVVPVVVPVGAGTCTVVVCTRLALCCSSRTPACSLRTCDCSWLAEALAAPACERAAPTLPSARSPTASRRRLLSLRSETSLRSVPTSLFSALALRVERGRSRRPRLRSRSPRAQRPIRERTRTVLSRSPSQPRMPSRRSTMSRSLGFAVVAATGWVEASPGVVAGPLAGGRRGRRSGGGALRDRRLAHAQPTTGGHQTACCEILASLPAPLSRLKIAQAKLTHPGDSPSRTPGGLVGGAAAALRYVFAAQPETKGERANARSSHRRHRPHADRPRLQGLAGPAAAGRDGRLRRRPAAGAKRRRRPGPGRGRLLRLRHAAGPAGLQHRPHHRPALREAPRRSTGSPSPATAPPASTRSATPPTRSRPARATPTSPPGSSG